MEPVVTEPSKKPLGCALSVITLNSSETFQCETKDLYEVLTNEAMVSAFTSGKCVVEACKGGRYVKYNNQTFINCNEHGDYVILSQIRTI